MENYEKLVQEIQAGKLDDLQFLLYQKDISGLYLHDMKNKGIDPDPDNARKWLSDFENKNLYIN